MCKFGDQKYKTIGQCYLYSPNRVREEIGNKVKTKSKHVDIKIESLLCQECCFLLSILGVVSELLHLQSTGYRIQKLEITGIFNPSQIFWSDSL